MIKSLKNDLCSLWTYLRSIWVEKATKYRTSTEVELTCSFQKNSKTSQITYSRDSSTTVATWSTLTGWHIYDTRFTQNSLFRKTIFFCDGRRNIRFWLDTFDKVNSELFRELSLKVSTVRSWDMLAEMCQSEFLKNVSFQTQMILKLACLSSGQS